MEHVICIDWERIPKLTDDDEPPKALSPYCSCIILGNRIEEYIKNRTKTEETLSKPDIQPEVTQKEVVEPTPVQTESYFLDIERYEKTYREISNMCETHKIHWNARDRGISNLSREYGRRLFNVVECIDKFLVELGYSALVQ